MFPPLQSPFWISRLKLAASNTPQSPRHLPALLAQRILQATMRIIVRNVRRELRLVRECPFVVLQMSLPFISRGLIIPARTIVWCIIRSVWTLLHLCLAVRMILQPLTIFMQFWCIRVPNPVMVTMSVMYVVPMAGF